MKDPLTRMNEKEQQKFWSGTVAIVALLCAIAFLVFLSLGVSKVEASPLKFVDDNYICGRISTYSKNQQEAIWAYCLDLKERG